MFNKGLTYRSSSIQIRNDLSKERQERAKSTQPQSHSHSQQLSFQPMRVNSSRYASKGREQNKRQKNLTEGKAEKTERKDSKTPVRYRLATSVKSNSKQDNGWEGVLAHRIPTKKDMLRQQQSSLAKLEKLKNSINAQKLSTPIRYKAHQQRQKTVKEIYKLKPRPLKGYIEYIFGQNCEFYVGFDYSYLKNLTRAQASAAIDFNAFAILESVQLCALDILEANEESGNKLLKEYGLLYFRHFEKNMMELVLSQHYFRLVQSSLFLFLLNCRIYFMILHELAAADAAVPQYGGQLKQMLLEIVQTQRIIYQGRSDIDKQNNYVAETLKILKITSQVQKKAISLATKTKEFVKSLQKYQRLHAILGEFEHLQESKYKQIQFQLLSQTEVVVGWEYLAIPPIPYLPPTTRPYTLVLSIENTLIRYDSAKKTMIYRPYLDHFLTRVASEFQLVAFSSQPKAKADQLINCIQKLRKYFAYRLYKDHLSLGTGGMVKDLSKLGRETEKVLMVDAYVNAPGVWRIPQFTGSSEDRVLVMLQKELLLGLKGGQDLSQQGGYLGSLQHIEQQEDENTISTIQ